MKKKRTHQRSERGQSLVEMAFSIILLMLLLAGAVDFSIALYSYVSIRDAAQEGALYASIDPTNVSEIQERVWSSSDAPVDLRNQTSVTATVITTGGEVTAGSASATQACEGHGSLVRVEVSYDYQLIMPLLPDILGVTEIPLRASVTNSILQPTCSDI